MEFLASDALNGRGSGTRDEWIAASYLGAQMQQWGLEPLGDSGGFVQQVEIERLETAAPPTLSVGGKKYTHGQEIRVQVLSAARVSGALQKYSPGAPVKPGAVLLMPAPPPARAPGPQSRRRPVTTGAVIVLTLENPNLPKPASARLPAPPPRFVGVESPAPRRPTTVVLNQETYSAMSALAEGTTVVVEAEVKRGSENADLERRRSSDGQRSRLRRRSHSPLCAPRSCRHATGPERGRRWGHDLQRGRR